MEKLNALEPQVTEKELKEFAYIFCCLDLPRKVLRELRRLQQIVKNQQEIKFPEDREALIERACSEPDGKCAADNPTLPLDIDK